MEAGKIFGKYHLVEKIATGGMAEVFKAKSYGVAGFEKTLVIKKILPSLASDQKFVDMFLDEAKIASQLSHINVVQIFDLGREGTDYFIAMEFVDGLDLKTLVEKARQARRPVPVNMMAFICSEVAKGLDYAHRRKDQQRRDMNIVHRDISPHNVLVSHAGEVKITDFGIARATFKTTTTRSGVIRGKFAYMSPEQARGDSIDRRSDVFSLGIVLYEVITGTRLFKSKNDLETLKRVQTGPITPPSRLNPEVGADLEAIVMRALERDRERRYHFASELYDDLSSYLFAAGQKLGTSELAAWVARVVGPQEEENDRTTDFDAFVNAIEEIGEGKPAQTMLTPLTPGPAVESSVKSRSRARSASSDEPTRAKATDGGTFRTDASASAPARGVPRKGWGVADEPDTSDLQGARPRDTASVPGIVRMEGGGGPDGARQPKRSDSGTRPVAAAVRDPAAVLSSAQGRLVGRSDELKRTREILSRVARGEGQTLVFTGADGSGKSRLIEELMHVSREMDVAFYIGRARREMQAVPYGPIREILRDIVGVRRGDPDDVVLERVGRLAQLGLSPAEVHFVGALFGLHVTGSAVPSFEGAERRHAIASALEKIVLGLARERPVILGVEDLEAADELTCSVLDHLASAVHAVPVLVLGSATGRISCLPRASSAPGRYHVIELLPLSEFAVSMLARGVLDLEDLGSSIAELLHQRTGGNALRVREVIRFLLATGNLRLAQKRALLDGSPETLFVPTTIAMLASDAVGRLPHDARAVLSAGAALGERFDTSLVSAGVDVPVEPALTACAAAGFLRPEDDAKTAWRFEHRLYREAAISVLPKEEAVALHGRLADALGRLPERERADHFPSLWNCLAAAGRAEAALETLERTGENLLREGDGAALAGAAEAACTMLSDAPLGVDARKAGALRARAQLVLASLQAAGGDHERVRTTLDRARAAAESSTDPDLMVRVERAFAEAAVRRGESSAAAEHFDRARRIVEEQLDAAPEATSSTRLSRQRLLIDLEIAVARQLRLAGEATRALRRCKDAHERAQELRESQRVGAALEELANIHEKLGEHARAMKLWDLAVGIWMKINDKRALMRSFEVLGTIQLDEGDCEGAKNILREALELSRETGDVDGTARLLNLLARAHLKLKQYAPAQALFLESQGLARRFQLRTLVHLAAVYLAALTAYTTDLQEGIRQLETTLSEWATEQPDKFGLMHAELLLGNTYKMARRVGPTNLHYVRALGLARDLGLDRYVREITREMKEAF